jgi:hypothetical protein
VGQAPHHFNKWLGQLSGEAIKHLSFLQHRLPGHEPSPGVCRTRTSGTVKSFGVPPGLVVVVANHPFTIVLASRVL